MLSQNQNLASRSGFPDKTARFQSTHPRHADVEQYDVAIQPLRLFNCLNAIGGFVHDFQALLLFRRWRRWILLRLLAKKVEKLLHPGLLLLLLLLRLLGLISFLP